MLPSADHGHRTDHGGVVRVRCPGPRRSRRNCGRITRVAMACRLQERPASPDRGCRSGTWPSGQDDLGRSHHQRGVRPDALRWHPEGLAIDVMIPNPSSAAGIALGNEIVSFALKNADKFSLQDCIWRGTYYTPKGPSGSGYGHYDHVHITTHGGGYPKGGEVYLR